MIDWPNVLAGFVFGVLATLLFWIPDRLRSARQRRADIWDSWKVAMNEIELLSWRPETRSWTLHVARSRYPIDKWRTVLKEREGFVLLEELEAAYASTEHYASQLAAHESPENRARFVRAESDWNAARTDFANYSRRAQADGYEHVVRREGRQRLWDETLRHPIGTMRRLLNDAKTKKASS